MPKGRYLLYIAAIGIAILAAVALSFEPTPDSNPQTYRFTQPDGWKRFWYDLLQQLAVAIALSAAVFEIVERRHQARVQKIEESTFKKTLAETIESAFSTFYDGGMIKKVTGSIFASPLIREKLEVNYRVSPLEGFDDFCVFEICYTFTIVNAGSARINHDFEAMLSSKFAPFEGLENKPAPEILSAKVGRATLTPDQLAKLNARIDVEEPVTKLKLRTVTIKPGEKVDVECKIRTFKQLGDSETFRSNFPSKKTTITFKDDSSRDLSVGIAEIGAFELPAFKPEPDDPKRYKTKIEEPTLPHYGWVLFWNDVKRFGPASGE